MKKNKNPSITIAIPARNETKVLKDTVKKLLALDYEKTEIIVVDDCSQDNTSEIIKSLAHKGVRFVEGKEPPEGWLGKNHAMKTLAEQASGDYILYTDADNPFDDNLLETMLSIVTKNDLSSCVAVEGTNTYLNFISQALFQPWPLLYEGTMFRAYRKNYKVSNWMVERAGLTEYLEDNAQDKYREYTNNPTAVMVIHDELTPTDFSDASVIRQSSVHSFLPNKYFSVKKNHNYFIRILYHSHKASLLNIVMSLLFFLMSLAFTISGYLLVFFAPSYSALLGSMFMICGIPLSLLSIILFDDGINPLSKRLVMLVIRLLVLPFTYLYCLILLTESYVKYKTNKVQWRGRNICYPE